MKRLRFQLANVALIGVSVAVALVLLEAGLRLADGVPLTRFPNFVHERVNLLKINLAVRYDAVLGWTLAPNIHGKSPKLTFTTDEHGNRLPSTEPRPLPLGGIVAVGDSFTAGSEVSDGESWPAVLEQLQGVPVVNAAAGAWGADQIVLQAERQIEAARPKTIIVSFLWHDILRAEYRTYGGAHKPYFLPRNDAPSGDGLAMYNNPVPVFSGNAREIGWTRRVLGHSYLLFWLAPRVGYANWASSWDLHYKRSSPDGTGIEISCRLLRRLKAKTDQAGVRLLFLMQYGSGDFDQSAPPAAAAQVVHCARAAEIQTVDPWPSMKAIFERDRQQFRQLFVVQADGKTLGHMSVPGNALMARQLDAALRAGP